MHSVGWGNLSAWEQPRGAQPQRVNNTQDRFNVSTIKRERLEHPSFAGKPAWLLRFAGKDNAQATIVTYNVDGVNHLDQNGKILRGSEDWFEALVEAVRYIIDEVNPQILALQEVSEPLLQELNAALGHPYLSDHIFTGPPDGKLHSCVGAMIRSDVNVTKMDSLRLREGNTRGILRGTFRPDPDHEFMVVILHLVSMLRGARATHPKRLEDAQKAAGLGADYYVGDYNIKDDANGRAVIAALCSGGLVEARTGATYCDGRYGPRSLDRLVAPLEATGEVLGTFDAEPFREVSHHLPVFCVGPTREVTFQGASRPEASRFHWVA